MELNEAKNKISKYSREKGIDIQAAWDIFFFDELIHRLSLSKYRDNFVFKGGYYLQNILGVETRSTMDIDFKMIGVKLSDEELLDIMNHIISVNSNNGIIFEVLKISNITAETKYGGKTVKISAKFYNVKKVFGVDIGFGDVVTPNPMQFFYKPSYEYGKYNILAYSIETSIAEKFETIISKGTNNSRSKDLIDIYLYMNNSFDAHILNAAIINTFHLRGTRYDNEYIKDVLSLVFDNERHFELFENYRLKNGFAKNITYQMCKESVYKLVSLLKFENKIKLSDYDVKITLVRHGQDDEKMTGGWSDNHISKIGQAEIKALLSNMEDSYDAFISSDLNRAKESAEILNSKVKMSIMYDERFRETNNGDLKNLTKKEFKEKYPGLFYSSLKMNERYPNGESPNDFYKRVTEAFIQMLNDNRSKNILLVTHGGVITVILSLLNGYPYSNLLKITPRTGSLLKFK